jgi:hypothetical protein
MPKPKDPSLEELSKASQKLKPLPKDPLAIAKKNVRAIRNLAKPAGAAPLSTRIKDAPRSTNVQNRVPMQKTMEYEAAASQSRYRRRIEDIAETTRNIFRDAAGKPRKRPRK